MLLVLLIGILFVSNVYSFTHHTKGLVRSLRLYNKTPLTANGKRVEADPGSSLMAVSMFCSYNQLPPS